MFWIKEKTNMNKHPKHHTAFLVISLLAIFLVVGIWLLVQMFKYNITFAG